MKGKVRPRYCDSIKLKESACKLLDRSRRLRTSGPQILQLLVCQEVFAELSMSSIFPSLLPGL
jgi:hypothetical protein